VCNPQTKYQTSEAPDEPELFSVILMIKAFFDQWGGQEQWGAEYSNNLKMKRRVCTFPGVPM
jgi:hypothetical protein